MEAHEIYEKLREKQVSARMIAQVLGVTNQSVSDVIRNGRGSKRIAEALPKCWISHLKPSFHITHQNSLIKKKFRFYVINYWV